MQLCFEYLQNNPATSCQVIPISKQNINNTNSLSPGTGVEVSQGEYNISSEESGKSLFTVTSNLSVTAAKSSHVDCLASVSALPTPLRSSVRLTVGERTSCFTLKNMQYAYMHTNAQRGSSVKPLFVLSYFSSLSPHFFFLICLSLCVSLCSFPFFCPVLFWEACESSLSIIIEEWNRKELPNQHCASLHPSH